MYAIQVTRPNGEQVPTFYLNERVQGILSKHGASIIAAHILFGRGWIYLGRGEAGTFKYKDGDQTVHIGVERV